MVLITLIFTKNNMFYKILKKFVIYLFIWMVFFSIVNKVKADVNYETWYCPSWPCPQSSNNPLSSGTLSGGTMNYNWGGGQVLDSGRSDYVVVHLDGYITVPIPWHGSAGDSVTVTFYNQDDDGSLLKIDGITVIDDWSGLHPPATRSGTITLQAGETYSYERWFAEWTGGAVLRQLWDVPGYHASWTWVSATYDIATTIPTPTAGISSSQQTTVNTARAKTQNGNAIYITQSGVGIDLDIVQDGNDNLIIGKDLTSSGSIQGDYNEITLTQKNNDNVLGIDVNGNSNDVDVWQDTGQRAIVEITGNSNTLDLEQLHLSNSGEHFARVEVNGNSNSLTIDQKETGDKILFLDVDNSNNVQVDQKGTGDHYLNIILTDSHTLDITQDGSGSHDAHINLSGNNTSITLTQDSSTDQNYYLEQNCVSASCSATVTQN